MIRLVRLATSSAVSLVAATALVLVALAAPVAPGNAAAAVPNVVSPSPSASGICKGCVSPQDAICWEGVRCTIPLIVAAPVPHVIAVHYATVPMTAVPGLDYVPVQDAIVTFQPDQTVAYAYVQLLPNPGMTQNKQLGLAFGGIVGGTLVRPQAIVTITPSAAPH